MIISYKDASAFGKRAYRIDDGAVHLKGVTIAGSEYESRFEVGQLDPNFDNLRLRSPLLPYLALYTVIGIVGSVILGNLPPSEFVTFAYYFCLVLGAFGLVFGLLSLRLIRVARFKSVSGVPLLDIFEAGPRKAEFQSFISTLQDEIRKKEPIQRATDNDGAAPRQV